MSMTPDLGGRPAQAMVRPPDTDRVWPVTKPASSEQK